MPKSRKSSKKLLKKPVLFTAAAIVIIVVILLVLHFRNRPTSGTIPSQNPAAAASNKKPVAASSESSSGSASQTNSTPTGTAAKDSSSAPAASGTLIAPYGDFVSNHSPSLSERQAESSVCNTTPGATCYIKFTKDGITKQLSPEVTDTSGTAYWSWNVKEAGLTSGNWVITAVASLDGSTKTTKTDMPLSVAP
jgi:cytoskeletal protein RodZ